MDTILFDLDGTLLPLEHDKFIGSYLEKLENKFASLNHDTKNMIDTIWAGTKAMVLNDGSMTNEDRFWETFCGIMGEEASTFEPVFESYYKNEFNTVGGILTPQPLANECVKALKNKGYVLVLATNPLFPKIATLARMAWAGLDTDDFSLITTYENSSYSKPNLDYYKEVLNKIQKNPKECLMVGNDVIEDMCVSQLGMDAYLITDHITHGENADLSLYRHGSFADFAKYADQLPAVGESILFS